MSDWPRNDRNSRGGQASSIQLAAAKYRCVEAVAGVSGFRSMTQHRIHRIHVFSSSPSITFACQACRVSNAKSNYIFSPGLVRVFFDDIRSTMVKVQHKS